MKINCTRKQITMPSAWWAYFEQEAQQAGLSLSAWLGQRGLAGLPQDLRTQLERTRRGRGQPRKV